MVTNRIDENGVDMVAATLKAVITRLRGSFGEQLDPDALIRITGSVVSRCQDRPAYSPVVSADLARFPFPDWSSRADPARFAAAQQAAFTGYNLTVGHSSVVHGVEWVAWLGTLTLPAPACRQAYGGPGTHGELRPTRRPVTCLRCRRAAGEDVPLLHEDPAQLALFPLPLPRHP